MATFISTSSVGILTTFGKFSKLVKPGLKFFVPIAQDISVVSLKTQQKDFKFRILTKDRAFANMSIAIQYRVKEEDAEKSFFSLTDPIAQMSSYVENSIRSYAPQTTLNSLFESFDTIGTKVSSDLSEKMKHHGFTIENILMTGIDPDNEVTNAINSIAASERLKEAAKNEADAHYIKRVKDAEADRDRKILQGEGVAGQRKAILEGYTKSVEEMINMTGLTPAEILNFVIKTQELDTREQIGKSANAKVLFMNQNSLNERIISSIETAKLKKPNA